MKRLLLTTIFTLAGATFAMGAGGADGQGQADHGAQVLESVGGSAMVSVTNISGGVVHHLPLDVRDALMADQEALRWWEDITPLARNEWICWVESAKKVETRRERIRRLREELKEGMRRPCCWAGCKHRERTGR